MAEHRNDIYIYIFSVIENNLSNDQLYHPQVLSLKPVHTCTTAGYGNISVYSTRPLRVYISGYWQISLAGFYFFGDEHMRSHSSHFVFLTIGGMWCNSPLCYNPIGMCTNPFSRCQLALKRTQIFTLLHSEKAKADYAQRESLTSRSIVCRTDLFHILTNDFGNGSWYSLCHTSNGLAQMLSC